MAMTKYLLTLLLAAAVRQGFADDKATIATAPVPSAAPAAASAAQPQYGSYDVSAAPSYGPYAAAASDPDAALSKLDHLRLAARHLQAAGLSQETEHVRQIAAKEAAKERANSKNESIIVQLGMFEVSLTKLGHVNSEKYGGSKDMTLSQFLSKLQASLGADADAKGPSSQSDDRLWTLFQALHKDGLASVRAQPTVMTIPGQPASIFVGGQIGYQTKDADGKDITMFKEYGTRANVLTSFASDGRIHLDVGLRVSQLVPASSAQVEKNSVPAITASGVKSDLDLRSGQTVLLGGLAEQRTEYVAVQPDGVRQDTNRVQTFVLVKAEIATKEAAQKALIEK
jgi:type II secretory pathway component GspD/PulD (secretin)